MKHTDYGHVKICPVTEKQLTEHEYRYSQGICPKCGFANNATTTHHEKIIGRWLVPNLFERLFLGKRTEFIKKEDAND